MNIMIKVFGIRLNMGKREVTPFWVCETFFNVWFNPFDI